MNGGGLPGTLPVIGQGQPRGGRAGIAGASAPLQQSALQQDPAVAAGDTPPIKIPTIEDILPGWGGRFPGTVSMMEQFKAANEAERALKLSYGDRLNTWLMMGGLNKLMGENCLFKGGIALGGGWALGAMFGAFLAPFDTMGGLRVRSPHALRKDLVGFRMLPSTCGGRESSGSPAGVAPSLAAALSRIASWNALHSAPSCSVCSSEGEYHPLSCQQLRSSHRAPPRASSDGPARPQVSENATAKETAVATLKQTGTKAHSLGKAFAMIGGVYSITECSIESVRLPPTNPHGRINRSILGWDFPPD